MIELDEVLQDCLEEIEDGRSTAGECLRRQGDLADSLAPLLQVAGRCRQAPDVRPSTAFRGTARQRMLNSLTATDAAQPESRRQPWAALWPKWSMGTALLRVAIALIACLVIGGSTVALAQTAMPGSPLYPAKLAIEDARLALAWTTADRVGLYLDMSDNRLSELKDIADGATDAELQSVQSRYESSVESAVNDTMQQGAPSSLVSNVESRLGNQAEQLQNSVDAAGSHSPGVQEALRRSLAFVEQERAKLGPHHDGENSQPGMAGSDPGDMHHQQAPVPSATPSSTPAAGETTDQHGGEQHGDDMMPDDPHSSAGQWMSPAATACPDSSVTEPAATACPPDGEQAGPGPAAEPQQNPQQSPAPATTECAPAPDSGSGPQPQQQQPPQTPSCEPSPTATPAQAGPQGPSSTPARGGHDDSGGGSSDTSGGYSDTSGGDRKTGGH